MNRVVVGKDGGEGGRGVIGGESKGEGEKDSSQISCSGFGQVQVSSLAR